MLIVPLCDRLAPMASELGYHLHQPGSGYHLYTPGWNCATWFKPLAPQLSGQPQDLHPCRLSELVRAAGTRRRVSFLEQPDDLPDGQLSPYALLRQQVWQMLEQMPGHPWLRLFLARQPHRRPSLPNTTGGWLLRGWLYGGQGHEHARNPDRQSLLLLGPSAVRSLQALLTTPSIANELSDPASPVMLQFYQAARDVELPEAWQGVHEGERPTPAALVHGGAGHLIARSVQPVPGAELPQPDRATVQALPSWSKLVRQLSVAEQMHLLRQAFEPSLLAGAFGGTVYEQHLTTCRATRRRPLTGTPSIGQHESQGRVEACPLGRSLDAFRHPEHSLPSSDCVTRAPSLTTLTMLHLLEANDHEYPADPRNRPVRRPGRAGRRLRLAS